MANTCIITRDGKKHTYTKLLGRMKKKRKEFPRASQPSSIIGTNIYYIQQVNGSTTQECPFLFL
jgi:hypothetical protein